MKEYQSLSHSRWDCKYHVVFIPKRCDKGSTSIIFGTGLPSLKTAKQHWGKNHGLDSNPCRASSSHQPGALHLRHTGLAYLPKVIFRLLCYPRVGMSAILYA